MKHLLIIGLLIFTSCANKKEIMKNETMNTIDGSWIVSTLKNVKAEDLLKSKKIPFIKIEGDKISGTNGCNNIMTSFTNKSKNTFSINGIAETRMFCLDMKIPNTFNTLLKESTSYKITDTTLTFFNKNNKTTIVFHQKTTS